MLQIEQPRFESVGLKFENCHFPVTVAAPNRKRPVEITHLEIDYNTTHIKKDCLPQTVTKCRHTGQFAIDGCFGKNEIFFGIDTFNRITSRI